MFLAQHELGPVRDGSNLMVSLQHDIGSTCTEYTWSAEDGMMGIRLLHNFGKYGQGPLDLSKVKVTKRIEEEELMEGGLRGRISAGAELYFSSKEKSGGSECRGITLSPV
jgi:distribution and morphology protein 10